MARFSRLMRFGIVGVVGFIVDSGFFMLLYYGLSTPLMTARVIAFAIAATVTWYGNRIFTFQQHAPMFAQWQRFFLSACLSLIPNVGLFIGWITLFGQHGYHPFLALSLGVGGGMLSNFLLSQYWVFKHED